MMTYAGGWIPSWEVLSFGVSAQDFTWRESLQTQSLQYAVEHLEMCSQSRSHVECSFHNKKNKSKNESGKK